MTAPKKPQDRLPKQAAVEESHPDGWDLLKPFDQVPAWDQAELIQIVTPMLPGDGDADESDVKIDLKDPQTLRIVGELAKRLQDFAADGKREDYLAFVSGRSGLINAVNLGFAYAMQLGESARSSDS